MLSLLLLIKISERRFYQHSCVHRRNC
jgi:hypothetical protein